MRISLNEEFNIFLKGKQKIQKKRLIFFFFPLNLFKLFRSLFYYFYD
jgi:hypothetical protein